MNKKTLKLILILSSIWIILQSVLPIWEFAYENEIDYFIFRTITYTALGSIVFVAFFALKKWGVNENDALLSISEHPIIPLRILTLVIFLSTLIYPAFFLDKGYFSSSLISSIDILEIEQLTTNSETIAYEESAKSLIVKIESAKNSPSIW